jgi:hypothetical protein
MKHSLIALSLLAVAGSLPAQSATPKISVRQLPAPVVSAEPLRSLAAVRHLPNGNVIVHDQGGRRVLLMDSSLAVVRVVADTTSATASAYGTRPGGLLAYRGDSTLFIDPASLSMLVIDPAGKVVRVMAAPRASELGFLVGGAAGNPGFDAQGRLVYRSFSMPAFVRGPNGVTTPPVFPDTEPLVRYDLATRKLDTAAFVKVYRPKMQMSQEANGGVRMQSTVNPLPLVDDWAVLSDGTIAIVRGRDYHVELIGPTGAKTVAAKIPYDWQRLTDEDKVAFIDSTKAVAERQRAAAAAGAIAGAGPPGTGAPMIMMRVDGGDVSRAGPPPREGSQQITVNGTGGPMSFTPTFVSPSELPDYKPVFGVGAVRADMNGRIWVRTIPTKPTTGGAIYDVIDGSGKLVDRVQVPTGTTIIGFGTGGVVYLGGRDATGIKLQRTRER